MSQQQDPLPIEVETSAGGWSWQIEPTYAQIIPHQQDALPMSIVPFRGGRGGEDEEELISRLRSGPLLSPPQWLGPFSSASPPASPPNILVALWDPTTWSPPPPRPLQINHAAAALPGFGFCGSSEDVHDLPTKLTISLGDLDLGFIHCYLSVRPEHSVRIRNLDDDGEEEMESKEIYNRLQLLIVLTHHDYPYGPRDFLVRQFRKHGELEYCIHCKEVFPSDTRPSDLRDHLLFSHGTLFQNVNKRSWEGNILLSGNEKPKEVLGGLWEGCESASEAARGDGEPMEINPEKSGSGHVESPLAFDQSNTLPEMMRLDNGKAVAITDAVQNCFEETSKADKPKGTSKTKWSGVWEHFVEITIDDMVWADCKHCNKRLAADSKKGGTSSLHRHLAKLHGIKVDKASSSKNENLCGGPATSESNTPTPSPRPPLAPRTTAQRKKMTTDGANDVATQEVSAGGKRTRRGDNPSCGVQSTRSRKLNQEANQEATQDFSIPKCIAALRTLEEFDPAEKAKAFVVFKSVENREIFLSAVDETDGSALIWLRSEIDKLT